MRVALIPARGGSRRIKGKNIKSFFGRPILHYSIDTAKETGLFDRIVVSTDDDNIAEVARQGGAEVVMRSEAMSENDVGTQEVAADFLKIHDPIGVVRYLCVIYATSPLMRSKDIIDGFNVLEAARSTYSMSVGAHPLRDAGQWYWGVGDSFRAGLSLIDWMTSMLPVPENRICDINTYADWKCAEEMYAKLRVTA